LLSAARIALIAGQPDWTMTSLRSWRGRGKSVHDEMCNALQHCASPGDRVAAGAEITQIFDLFRSPAPARDFRDFWGDIKLTAFELGVIRAQLVEENPHPVDLEVVYRAVAAP
jgi:hypothetical protein